MKKRACIAVVLLVAASFIPTRADEPSQESPSAAIPHPTTVREARARARLLHETIHGTLQVVHRDFFSGDGSSPIPSASLSDVFAELSRSHSVEIKWLIVQTDVMNTDHRPQDAFEKQAAKQLAMGKPQFESAQDGLYRYAGPIRLASQCLKCHVKERTSNEDRTAGLLISMPYGDGTGETEPPTP